MTTDKKLVGVGIVGAALVIGGIALAKRKPELPPGDGEDEAMLQIEVYDSEGRLVPRNSPMDLEEGKSYTVVLTVKNTSTRAGLPWAATLSVTIHAAVTYGYEQVATLIPITTRDESFTAGQTKTFSYTMTVPSINEIPQIEGSTGQIGASVQSPQGTTLATAYEPLTIKILEIIYGATIVIS